jgi:hypothetical protein
VEEEEGIRFTGLLLGRDRRTGLVFLECGVDGTSTSTPRMLHVLLVRVVALNAATAIALLLLPDSLFKKTSTLTKTNSRTFPNQKNNRKKKKKKQSPRNLPEISRQIHNKNTHGLSLNHTQKKLVICTQHGNCKQKKGQNYTKGKKHSTTLDAERET